jgi:hypothetical protein
VGDILTIHRIVPGELGQRQVMRFKRKHREVAVTGPGRPL